jgi:ATP-dependent RNA helicase RhlE
MHQTSFATLGLIEPILKAVEHEGYTTPTPIQAQSIPYLLEGRDLLGCAQTGTGKTAAFAIPLIQRLVNAGVGGPGKGRRPIKALILTPTRELAIQIDESFRAYGRHTQLRTTVIFGGVGQKPQTDALRAGIDILVATPGRLLDLMSQGYVSLKELEYFVLDEADRMLDMGFIHDVKKVIAALPKKRQTLFFSATMPADVQRLASSLLTDPVKVEVTPVSSTAETVQQQVYFTNKAEKAALLIHLMQQMDIRQVLVFTRTKHGADKLARHLVKAGITADAIHGNKAQNYRQRALNNFKDRKIRALVATDIAARGIDIDSLGFVVNHDIPNVPETYVHRIGRTGRAGASGLAISLCEPEEVEYLRDIQKLIKRDVPVVEEHPFPMAGGTPVVDPGRKHAARRSQQPRREQRPPQGRQPRQENRPESRRPEAQRNGQRQGPRPERKEQPEHHARNGKAAATTDYAALTAELLKDLDAAAGKTENRGGQRKRRFWRRSSGR